MCSHSTRSSVIGWSGGGIAASVPAPRSKAALAADRQVEDDQLRRVYARQRLGADDGGGCAHVEAALDERGRQPLAETRHRLRR